MATSSSPLNIAASRTLQAVRSAAAASFLPLFRQDFSGQIAGNTNADYLRGQYSNVTAKSGSISTLMTTNPGQLPATCGGGHSFGGRQNLPILIPVGQTVWQRYFFYLPSAFSMGYVFGTSDSAAASTCGKNSDGSGYIKWLVFAPNNTTARIYLLPENPKGAVNQAANDGIAVIAETGAILSKVTSRNLPRDQWFSLQLAVKVSKDTSDGFMRAWLNDDMVVERTGINTIGASAAGITEFGVGDYWNGVPYTDGAAGRDAFYIDEILVATDVAGYGAPTGIDASGNAYISNTILAGNF
jgi:hypothetical protein